MGTWIKLSIRAKYHLACVRNKTIHSVKKYQLYILSFVANLSHIRSFSWGKAEPQC